ncbi:MAG TPA: 7TM domain-containing protein, partial [Patescibacteria group bacterium]|nr:7TM domain-containing protein [Patescibacteria group bacterium]
MAGKILIAVVIIFLTAGLFRPTFAQTDQDITSVSPTPTSTPSTQSAHFYQAQLLDLTGPNDARARRVFTNLFSKRPISEPNFFNVMEYSIQYAVRIGVPPNVIILILLLPFLATLIVFFRQIIGIPTLELLVPITIAITLLATGLEVGTILLLTILFGSIISRIILKRVR